MRVIPSGVLNLRTFIELPEVERGGMSVFCQSYRSKVKNKKLRMLKVRISKQYVEHTEKEE